MKVVRNAVGSMRRLSAAVIVNNVAVAVANGKPTAGKPLSAAQMEQINALVREAIGFSKDRGDSVQVVNAPFTAIASTPVEELPLWRQPEMQSLARSLAPWLALPLVALIAVFGLVRPAMRAARRHPEPRLLAAKIDDAIALDANGAVELQPLDEQTPLLPTAQAARQQERSTQLESIRQLARQDPATVANVVRNWASQPA